MYELAHVAYFSKGLYRAALYRCSYLPDAAMRQRHGFKEVYKPEKGRKRKGKRGKVAGMWASSSRVIHVSETTLQNSWMAKYKWFWYFDGQEYSVFELEDQNQTRIIVDGQKGTFFSFQRKPLNFEKL